ncbi:DUF4282 domain-containing protein [Allobranchiibius sp. CTAmp26]|uniref:DUF4282 domain-containing protein n=1 Tax=Allobranchiibius sp. CTAmp26 TaxID=2815214 RepID=UPI001AA1757A|nr:DUF4282 domain-containing protein [Allobranchiibius sp. CTAmp26]MBO1753845.1 DUF4282 domain-containing protein [Allobranchiibius sp. CTAmp26]
MSDYGNAPQPHYGEDQGPGGYQGSGGPGQPGGPGNAYPPGPPIPSGGPQAAQNSKGFFGALFDFSFTHFVTPIIVKVVYILATVVLVLGWLGFVIVGFNHSAGSGLLFLIVGAIGLIVYLALIRMTLEFYLAIVRMSQDIHQRLR